MVTGGGGFPGRRGDGGAGARAAAGRSRWCRRAQGDFDLVHEADVMRLYEAHRPQVVHPPGGGGGRHRRQPREPGQLLLPEPGDGRACSWSTPARPASRSSWPSGPSARIPSSPRCRSRRRTSGAAIRRRPTRPTASPRRRCWSRPRPTATQYGFNAIYLLPVNLYGPRDNFDPESSHVIPALIRSSWRRWSAGTTWSRCGAPGRATREFLYVDDAAEGIVLATEHYDGAEPVNLGAGLRDLDQGPGGADRAPHRLPGPPGLEHVEARRPAPPLPRHDAGRALLRVPRRDAVRGGAAPHDRVVPLVALTRPHPAADFRTGSR